MVVPLCSGERAEVSAVHVHDRHATASTTVYEEVPAAVVVTLVENHWDGIIAWHKNHLSNGLLEGINSLVQAAKVRARGHRSKTKMITIVYLTAAKLQLPTLTSPTPAYMSSRCVTY
jgi:hypothetical protein